MKSHKKKPEQGCSGYKLETTALNYKDNYTAFRIRCIMLILGKVNKVQIIKSYLVQGLVLFKLLNKF